jgi:hypothetical protein
VQPNQLEMFERGPRPHHVNRDHVRRVGPHVEGGVTALASRGKREYRIRIPEAVLATLLAKLAAPD